MFDALSDRLGGIFDRLRRKGALSEGDVTAALREVLDATPRRGEAIVADDQGRALRYTHARHAVAEVRKQIGAEAYDLHALRHTAAHELAQLGCSDEMIMAITGHQSRSMVAHYAGAARQKSRAKEVQEKRK